MRKTIFIQTVLFALIVALGAASLSFAGVSALGWEDPNVPPQGELTAERLEKIWARQLKAFERMGKVEQFIGKAQKWIDRAKENDRDVSAVQAALDAFVEAVQNAKPIYASAEGIVNAHQGFDENGKVTDIEMAKATVSAMRGKLQEIRAAMGGSGKALHEAFKLFREANPKPEKSPTP